MIILRWLDVDGDNDLQTAYEPEGREGKRRDPDTEVSKLQNDSQFFLLQPCHPELLMRKIEFRVSNNVLTMEVLAWVLVEMIVMHFWTIL